MQGRIDKVWQNRAKNEKPYLTLEIGGQRYNLWDEDLFDTVKEGGMVEYDARQTGKFYNITALSPIDGNGAQPGNDLPDPHYRSREIRKMSCLKSANVLAASLDLSEIKDPARFTLDIARRYEGYVSELDGHGSDPEPA